jgi:hypothetical protein
MVAEIASSLLRATLVLFLLLLFGASGCRSEQAVSPGEPDAQPALDSVPLPSELPKLASYSDADRFHLGSEFDPVLPTNLVGDVWYRLLFRPLYDPETNPLHTGLSYAMYRFDVAGYSDEPSIHYSWQSFNGYEDSLWIGLANWESNAWEWHRCDASERLDVPSMGPYLSGAGQVVVTMAAYNPEQTTADVDYSALLFVRLGPRVGHWILDVAGGEENVTMVDLALDSRGIPHIAFLDYEPGSSRLMYASKILLSPLSQNWDVLVVDDSGDTGLYPAIVVEANSPLDLPRICYRTNTANSLRLARGEVRSGPGDFKYIGFEEGTWIINVPSPHACSMALIGGSYCISYHDFDAKTLNYVYFNGLDWIDMVVDDSANVGFCSSLAENPAGRPAITYRNEDEQSLMFAEFTGFDWNISTIDPGGGDDIGMVSCLSYGPDNLPQVCYDDLTHGTTLYARHDGADWQHEAVFDLDAHAQNSAMVIDSAGVPHIATMDSDHLNLIHMWRESGSGNWLSETVDFGGGHPTGYCVSMAIDGQDRLYIAYGGYYKEGMENTVLFAFQLD